MVYKRLDRVVAVPAIVLRSGCLYRKQGWSGGLAAVVHTDYRRPVGEPARARPPGRAQRAGSTRRARELVVPLSHVRATAGGALIRYRLIRQHTRCNTV